MKCKEISERIAVHLKRMERDHNINKGGHYDGHWLYYADSIATTKVYVRYISFHGWTLLDKDDAEKYLMWLDAGNNGAHYKVLGRTGEVVGK